METTLSKNKCSDESMEVNLLELFKNCDKL